MIPDATPDGPTVPSFPEGIGRVRERQHPGDVPLHPHPQWLESFPWLVQGTTGRGRRRGDSEGRLFDLGLWGKAGVGDVLRRWRALRKATGMPAAAHAGQVHGTRILEHDSPPRSGLLVVDGADGHTTAQPGVLLAVSTADCVPVFLVDPRRHRVAALHAGWRGTAAGMVLEGIRRLGGDASGPSGLWVHLGPAICGRCYEVGPEVHEALGLTRPPTNTPVDVRAVQARQVLEAGVPPEQVTVSEHCTLCGDRFFSHRAGEPERQMGVIGIRP